MMDSSTSESLDKLRKEVLYASGPEGGPGSLTNMGASGAAEEISLSNFSLGFWHRLTGVDHMGRQMLKFKCIPQNNSKLKRFKEVCSLLLTICYLFYFKFTFFVEW